MIPKMLHQIWVGPRPAPMRYIDHWRQVCRQYGWEHRLWGDAEVEREVRYSLDQYKELGPSWCHRADLYRLELLYRHGGVYIDADTEPTGSDPALYLPMDADILCTCEHFFPSDDYHKSLWDNVNDPLPEDLCPVAIVLFCGFIAAAPRHPQTLIWLKALRDSWDRSFLQPREGRGPENGMPQFSYVMSRHLYYPVTLIPFGMMTGKPDSFARWFSILPAECYSLDRWKAIRKSHPHITDLHPEETR